MATAPARIPPRPATTGNAPATDSTGAKVKRGRVAKPKHSALDGDAKIAVVPDDYSSAKHAPLQESDFTPEAAHVFFDWKAAKLERQAVKLRDKAEALRRTGSFIDTKTAKKVIDLELEMKRLVEQLASQGEDVSRYAGLFKLPVSEATETPAPAPAA
jgi:hypothetical protein